MVWTSPDGEIVRTFCIVATGPNEVMAPIHDRMPVILRREDWPAWLSRDGDLKRVASMIGPAAAELMEAWPVSRRVSNAREEGVELIDPVVAQ